jgi:hypothetical protein
MSGPFEAVSTYFFAKDGNRPHDAVSFPESAKGVDAIEDILGRRFANDFENVYTFGLTRPTAANRHHFPCHWLVGMSAKNNGALRVGCGRYDWYFTPDDRCLVERLIITIDEMCVLSEAKLDDLMTWLSGLPYPWCTPEEAARTMPRIEGLAAIEKYLKEIHPIFPDGSSRFEEAAVAGANGPDDRHV